MDDREILRLFDKLEGRIELLAKKTTTTNHYFASGTVWINTEGVNIRGEVYTSTATANTVKWYYDDSGTDRRLGEFYCDYYGNPWFISAAWFRATRGVGDPWSNGAVVTLAAIDAVTSADVRLNVNTNGTIDVDCDLFYSNAPVRVGHAASDPAGGANGWIYYNTASNKFRKYENGAWADL